MTPVAAVLRRDPTKPAPVPPPWNIADWVWSEPWRDPVAPPPPNPAILPPFGASGVPAGMRLLADVDPAALALSGDPLPTDITLDAYELRAMRSEP